MSEGFKKPEDETTKFSEKEAEIIRERFLELQREVARRL